MTENKYAAQAGGVTSIQSVINPGIPPDLADLALLDIKIVGALVGLKSTAINDKVRKGEFPEPIRLGARFTRWKAGDIRAWLTAIHEAPQAEDLKQRQQERAKKASDEAKRRRAARLAEDARRDA